MTEPLGPVGARSFRSVRVLAALIEVLGFWLGSDSSHDAATGARPGRRDLSQPQLPPCQVPCRAAARLVLLVLPGAGAASNFAATTWLRRPPPTKEEERPR